MKIVDIVTLTKKNHFNRPAVMMNRVLHSNVISHSSNYASLFFLLSSASQLSGIEAEEEAGGERVTTYKVGMLGASEVGKTALTAQFTTSDYICAYDASLGKQMVAFSCFYVALLLI